MATERLDIIVRLNDASKAGSRKVKKNLNGIDVAAKSAVNSLKALAAGFLGIQAIFAAGRGFSTALRIFTEFDDVMRQVGAVTNATAKEMEALTETAKEMGATTRFTASQAADGLKFLGLAGFEAADAIKALPGVLQLAAAGSLELGQAADITTNILAAFGFEVEQLGFVNDVLVKTFTSSNNNLVELGEAFKLVGPIAKGVGANFEDLLAAIGKLGDAGIKASIGGTTLRGTLAALFNPTKEEARLMEDLSKRIGGVGLQIKDANGNFIGFVEIVKQLEKAGLRGEEALKLFGLRAGPGMAALLNQGSESLEELFDKLLDAGFIAGKIADDMEAGIGGATRELTAALEKVRIAFIDTFDEEATQGIRNLTEDVRGLGDAIKDNGFVINFWAKQWVKFADATIENVSRLTKVVLGLGSAMGTFFFFLEGPRDDKETRLAILKRELKEIFRLLSFRDKLKIEVEIDTTLSSFDNFKSKIQNFADAQGLKVNVDIDIDPVTAETKFKTELIRLRAALDERSALAKANFNEGLIDLDQFFKERESILKRQYGAEINLLNKKLDTETKNNQKALLEAAIFAKRKQLQTALIKLDQERFNKEVNLRKKAISEEAKLDKQRLQTANQFAQAESLINNLKFQNALSASDKLQDIQANEVLQFDKLQKEKLEKVIELSKTTLQVTEFTNQQIIEKEKFLLAQKERLNEADRLKREASEGLINDLKFQNALSNSQKLIDIQANERAILKQQQQQELVDFEKASKDLADSEILLNDFKNQQILQSDKLLANQKKALKDQELQNAQEVFAGVSQLSNDLFVLAGSNNKELFALSKAAAIAEATMNTYNAATKALAEGGPFAGPALAVIITLQGLANVARIQSQSLAEGGVIQGNSPHSKADNIPLVNTTAGEYVTNLAATKDFGLPFMNLVNSQAPTSQIMAALSKRGNFTNFSIPTSSSARLGLAHGGQIPSSSPAATPQANQSFNIINVLDPREVLSALNTTEGNQTILNIMGKNAKQVRGRIGV